MYQYSTGETSFQLFTISGTDSLKSEGLKADKFGQRLTALSFFLHTPFCPLEGLFMVQDKIIESFYGQDRKLHQAYTIYIIYVQYMTEYKYSEFLTLHIWLCFSMVPTFRS